MSAPGQLQKLSHLQAVGARRSDEAARGGHAGHGLALCCVGESYNRAARLMDELEDRGIVGPAQGNEPREMLIDLDGTGADGRGQTMHTMV